MKTYIGIDLGGTNIKGALVTEEGTILRRSSLPTGREQGAEAVTRDMAEMIRQLSQDTLDKVLYERSNGMKNAYARADA